MFLACLRNKFKRTVTISIESKSKLEAAKKLKLLKT